MMHPSAKPVSHVGDCYVAAPCGWASARIWTSGRDGACPREHVCVVRACARSGCRAIELDVHLSADDQVVVIHDMTSRAQPMDEGVVREKTLAELQASTPGAASSRVCRSTHPDARRGAGLGARTSASWTSRSRADQIRTPASSAGGRPGAATRDDRAGDRDLLRPPDRSSRQGHGAGVATGALYKRRRLDPFGVARNAGADAILPYWPVCDAETVEQAHAAGLSVHPWATSDPQAIAELSIGESDSICSNHPDRVVGVIGRRAPGGVGARQTMAQRVGR